MKQTFVFPTSFGQQRLWFLNQLDPTSSAYTLINSVHFHAQLDRAALQWSLDEIVQRHEALRTTFAVREGQPVQVVVTEMPAPLDTVDLRALAPAEREAAVQRIASEWVQQPFDLVHGPLVRLYLIHLDDTEYILLLTGHHIILDAWSLGIFFRELTTLYTAFAAGQPSPLPALPIQYADFAVWQRATLQGDTLARLLDYWRRQLADLPVLQLPTDRPRPAVASFQGARQSFVLRGELTRAMAELSQGEQCTLFMTLLAAFATLLHRYSGQTDLAIGSPIANRTRAELEGLIGFFVNTLVLRIDLAGDPSFRTLLQRVRTVALDAYAHQDVPFERLVEELQPERDLSRNPLIQVMLTLQNAPPAHEDRSGEGLNVRSGAASFDLALDLWAGNDGLNGQIEYSSDLFDDASIRRMITCFQVLLEGIVANPDGRLAELPLLTAVDLHQLNVWGSSPGVAPGDACVHHLFEQQVASSPDAIALVCDDVRLSYSQLNERADRLAAYLRTLGVDETLVGLCVPHSVEMAVGVLGILKAGAAYLPLDPAYPSERLALMLADANVPVLLVQSLSQSIQDALNRLPEQHRPMLLLSSDWMNARAQPEQPCNPAPTLMNLAYAIYTSGSTGEPRAVLVEHRALTERLLAVLPHYRYQPDDRVLQFASLSFDAATEELFAPWLSGATVVLRSKHMLDSFDAFHRMIEAEQLTVLNMPTAFWHAWVSELERRGTPVPPSVSLVIVGSERALPERLRSWQRLVGDRVRWINAYGPTETTITATLYTADAHHLHAPDQPVPIGCPIAGTQAYVLDSSMQLVPPGVPGELYLGGAGVARGYHQRPDLTAMRFVPNPLAQTATAGARLYRTGDRVRWRADGCLEFLARLDTQVKIRGFRIEPGEIEVLLARHPAVQAAAVVPRENSTGALGLVAYIVPRHDPDSPALDCNQLQAFLRELLPVPMLPVAYVALEALPLLPSGKLDRRGLPKPDTAAWTAMREYVTPRTPLETQMVMLWSEILGVEQVSIHDNFFHLGGHSLLATQLISRVRDATGAEVPLRSLFELPTVAGFSEVVEQCLRAQKPSAEHMGIKRSSLDDPEHLLSALDQMSDEDVDSLLTLMLAEEGEA